MRVKEVADLVGISVRTLHHYHEIGLLVPETITDSGYRLYSDHNLEMLQQILFLES
ncbi:MerR family transcriptional regulator [Amphibacillus xylanus NBRC 15112]|uniref:MerR family transcriptional regulator n=1 Tax=Amphibacillus xylanus (strain ATCC 51415 / DSM 6626 / JCM 7361 / LMG 17667 / NBRC 15112 / Ep01) TaxID=698758 RepID=K0IZI7_AMPXN|nr:MerR family transcriptional regulator [Amphibacillus xylanus NBRC 15112]